MGNMRFKVGDRVRVKSLDWYNENKDINGNVHCGDKVFDNYMSMFCGSIVTIGGVYPYNAYNIRADMHCRAWTDEMIECKVEEENKPKFKVGDEVRIKGTDIGGTIESVIRGQLIVNSKGSKIPAWPEDVVLMKSVEEETVLNKWTGLKVELELSKSVIGVSNVESLRGERFMSGFVKAIIPPEGYQFVDENGNIINATKIVLEKKKKEYPNNIYHCARTLGLHSHPADASKYKTELIRKLQTLLVCRDAYWKIAGEEMGLGKPWELSIGTPIYYIYYNRTVGTIKNDYADDIQGNIILAFPTAEMRDAFYENFKELIESVKELL